jgi:TetR/AcrR family fatty acid metabolism transcriptional regulator
MTDDAAQDRRDQKRERILDAAVRAFAAQGFHRTRVSEVAKLAGVADGTIYLYFEGKDDLLRAVFERAMLRFLARGREALAAFDDPVDRIREFVRLHLASVGEDRDLAVVFQVDLRQSARLLLAISRGPLAEYLEQLVVILEQGQSQGIFREDLPAREMAKMIFGVLDELSTNWVLSERNYRLESSTPTAMAFVLRAIDARSDARPGQ